ncbi:hypothetical protein AKJ41_01630 [candidate division MSBL1 archaeon SCGC-AAA259O05]|uniref:PIN domain-containing protein n=1 Tax=candidate division MSBL1 archaeon SCGC-AAA259O05 TaxID=1698271 RepID=A0A133V4S2_9EURY|nr:hypothetical protein AKJ41_01630 [candidate division MSBL1 archaeon SCGC-AAA259O05]
MSEVLCDTDILSALAKADSLHLLSIAFPGREFLISDHVRNELQKSVEAGFDFPEKIFELCGTTTVKEQEPKEPEELNTSGLSRTDVRNITLAGERSLPLATNDSLLYRRAKERGVEVYDLRQILKAVYETRKLSREEISEILNRIETENNTIIKNKKEIFSSE